jgi:hypothetical protein
MTPRKNSRWLLAGLAIPLAAGMALTTLGQVTGSKSGNDLAKAKEMAELVQKGQLSLREATTIAEEHVKGTALEGSCDISTTMTPPAKPAEPKKPDAVEPPKPPEPDQGKGAKNQTGEKRLMYEITCFERDRLQVVKVDGMTKKVVDVKDQAGLAGAK